MSETGAASAADVSAPSSSASKPVSAGRPSRATIVRSLEAKRAEKPTTEPASPEVDESIDAAPPAVEPEKKPEGDTANLDAGKGDKKPDEKAKEPETVPLAAFKERIAKEKARREKLETELHGERTEKAKFAALFEAAVAESERLAEQLRAGAQFNEQSEEIHSLRLQREMERKLADVQADQQRAIGEYRIKAQAQEIAAQWRSEASSACQEFPLVDTSEVFAALRKNPDLDIRQFVQSKHEGREALIKQRGATQSDKSNTPTTVAKPTGVSKFQAPLNAKGMGQALKHALAKR